MGKTEEKKTKTLILSNSNAVIPEGTVIIGEGAFAGNINIKNIEIPEISLDNYYTKGDIDGIIETIELKEGPAGKDGENSCHIA